VPKIQKILIYNKPPSSSSNTLLYQIATTQLYGFGSIRSKRLLHSVGNETDIFQLPFDELAFLSGFSIDMLKKMDRQRALQKAEAILALTAKHRISVLFYTDAAYPRRLKHCDDAPLVLYYKGECEFNNSRFVAVVGTRNASDYGRQLCKELIRSFSGNNITVVSGMAYGIDITIHQLCLQHDLPTIGVMAHGLDIIYPHVHRSIAHQMFNHGGLVSEYPSDTPPDRENFPMRNRIVAGLCDATIVVETKRKGGSLITAELANDYNRDVFTYPGSVFDENMQGCNQLIANNKAHLIQSGDDFLCKMGWNSAVKIPIQRSMFPNLNPQEQTLVRLLEQMGTMNLDTLATHLKLSASELSVLLFGLEMNGLVRSVPGNQCQLL